MCLKRIDIQGFKSFGDRIKLELHPGLSVVVGPNGSGKSNISDAVSWCLGEQRASLLRGSRMEDVIFAGSDKRKPVGLAEVTLTLDNGAKLFALPYEEISVTRRYYRSGESEFLINKVPCRLKDIQALFMDTGLGRGAYSLIGQGKVDEILSSRPEERRSVIEEAAGIVKFRHRKEEALRKLSAAQQDLNRISDIINELSGRIEPLAQQAETARQYKKLENEAWHLELALFKRDWQDLTTKAKEISRQLEQVKREFQDERPIIEEKLERARARLLSIEKNIGEARENAFAIESNLERVQNKITLVNEQISHQTTESQRVENELQESRAALQKLEFELTQEKEKLGNLKQAAAQVFSSAGDQELQRLEQAIEAHQELFQNLNTDLIDQLNQAANQRGIRNQAADRKEQLSQRLNHMRRIAGETSEAARTLGSSIDAAGNSLQKLEGSKQEISSGSRQAAEELKVLEQELSQLQSRLLAKKEETVAKHSRLKVLEENLSSRSGNGRPVRELLKASQESASGICGAVADLIKVPKGFETAIEAALGGALQNLVTETSAQAKAAIEYLKQQNLGRATFLPLDSLRPTPAGEWENKAMGLTGVIGLAADLIETEPKYRPVVALLLGRLVVVDTLDNAIQTAKQMQQRLRIVTLGGELFHPGGSLSGGGAVRNAGGMLHTRRERDELAQNVQELHVQIHELTEFQTQKQIQQRDLNGRLQDYQQQLVDLGLELQAAEMELSKANDELNRANQRSQESRWEIANIEQEIGHWVKTEAEAAAKLATLEQELAKLQDQLAATQAGLAADRDQKAQLEGTVHQEKVRQAELRQEILGLQKITDRLEKEYQDKKMSIASAEALLVHLNNRIRELEQQRSQLDQDLQRLGQEQSLALEDLKAKQAQQEAEAEALKQLENRWQRLQQQWQQTQEQIHILELQQARNQTELELLISRLQEYGIEDPTQITVEPVAGKRQAKADLQEMKGQMAALGPVNAAAEAEYQEVLERHRFLLGQKQDLEESRTSLEQLVEELNRLMSGQFENAFAIINQNFNTVFQQLFGGGGASMTLTGGDTLTCGIDITARPPGKKNQSLSLLSGGERALTAIALLFAILKYKPSPFCVLDEIEASLDEANVKRFADFLSRTSDEVQFIVVSHRKGTMERADALYGVTMDEAGVTRLLSLSLEEIKGNKRLA
ncbi:MAG: chromosome segregation protein SMC [Firmicutes bacterium]|nr:chromosome segregation protein SMC [Bacillota bacterium]